MWIQDDLQAYSDTVVVVEAVIHARWAPMFTWAVRLEDRRMLRSRPLYSMELRFLRAHFGNALQSVQMDLRLRQRRLAFTGQGWPIRAGHIALPAACFKDQNLRQPLRLKNPLVAGLFAHELLHQWQRLQGQAVTVESLWLQAQLLLKLGDPYAYEACEDPHVMLKRFLRANVGLQARIWQDHVYAVTAARKHPAGELLAQHVRAKPGPVHLDFRISR